jgi:hypothetical protein
LAYLHLAAQTVMSLNFEISLKLLLIANKRRGESFDRWQLASKRQRGAYHVKTIPFLHYCTQIPDSRESHKLFTGQKRKSLQNSLEFFDFENSTDEKRDS